MPDRQSHLQRARDNEQLARELGRNGDGLHTDWALVVLFYAALHYVDVYLAGRGDHPRDHQTRDDAIGRNPVLSPIYRPYRRLKDLSREARYQIANYPPQKLELADRMLGQVRMRLGL